ncbi:MAG: M28 family peptidase [Vicinamibacterales bacterium]
MSRRIALAVGLVLCASFGPWLGHGVAARAGVRSPPAPAQSSPADELRSSQERLPALLPPRVNRALDAFASGVDEGEAMDLVRYMDRYWRLAGNAGFQASQDWILERLLAAGYARGIDETRADGALTYAAARPAAPTAPFAAFDTFPNAGHGWDYSVGTLALVGDTREADEVLLSKAGQRVALCINSFSTPPEGVEADLVDVGSGAQPSDYDGRRVAGAIVIGSAPVARLWQLASERGALGVVSTALGSYVDPDTASHRGPKTPRDDWNVLQWGSIPYDEARKGFAFKATPKAAARLRERLQKGPVRLRATVASTFTHEPNRTLVAELPGRTRPQERIVVVAHVQEPGADDDASGCATLLELARAMKGHIASGRLPAPDRTITMLWVDEVVGSREWLAARPDAAAGVRYMISLDMTGADTSKTGGTFLIEKALDPSAVWERPTDPHTEWGKGDVGPERLKGTLLNDLVLAVCLQVARREPWVVRTNPYEGGSDHTAFADAGVPSLLAWHFTDRFYHTSLDRPDTVSASEMRRVAMAIGATVHLLATAREADAESVLALVQAAASGRLAVEERAAVGARASGSVDVDAALAAWRRWYGEALGEVGRLPVDGGRAAWQERVERARRAWVRPRG